MKMKIYDDGKLTEKATIREYRIVQPEGSRQVNRGLLICVYKDVGLVESS